PVAPVALHPPDPSPIEELPQHLAVPLLLADEQLDRRRIVGVADLFGVAGRRSAEVAAVGGLPELPRLERAGDPRQFFRGHLGAPLPRNGAVSGGVGAEVGDPLRRSQRVEVVPRAGCLPHLSLVGDSFSETNLRNKVNSHAPSHPSSQEQHSERGTPCPNGPAQGSFLRWNVVARLMTTLKYKVICTMQ